jgi:hypothetical protein
MLLPSLDVMDTARNIIRLLLSFVVCALCRLARSANHQKQQYLAALSCVCPFNVIGLDIWSTGIPASGVKPLKVLASLPTFTDIAWKQYHLK